MGWRIKNFNILGVDGKFRVLDRGFHENQYIYIEGIA